MTPKLKQTVFVTAIFALLGLLCLAGGGAKAITLLNGPVSYEEVLDKLFIPDQQVELKNTYTSVTIDNLYGPFDEKINYTTNTNRYGMETTTKSESLSYLFKLPEDDRVFQIDAYNIPTKKKLSEFAVAYQAYVDGETSEKPQPIEITGSFEQLRSKSSIESVILDAVPVPAEGYVLSDEMLLEAMRADGVNVDMLSEEQLKEIEPGYREAYKNPNQYVWTKLITLNYTFVADRLNTESYAIYYIAFLGFLLMLAAIIIFWGSYIKWKRTSDKQALSLENFSAESDLVPNLECFVSGKSTFILNEAKRISENRKKENKKSSILMIFGIIMFCAGIVLAIAEVEGFSFVAILFGIIVGITAFIRRKAIKSDVLFIEQELYLDLMIQGMTSEKLDMELSKFKVEEGKLGRDYIITENFVIQRGALGLSVVNLNRVLWAGGIFIAQNAKNTEKGAMLYDGTGDVNIPTKEGYSRVRSQYIVSYYGVTGEPLFDRYNKEIKTITGDEKTSKILLKELHETHPWIFMGREQMKYLHSNKRPEAVAIWKERRQAFL